MICFKHYYRSEKQRQEALVIEPPVVVAGCHEHLVFFYRYVIINLPSVLALKAARPM